MFGLEYLVSPLSTDEFLSKYWGKRAVLIPGNEKKFKELFGWNEVNHFLDESRGSYDGLRLIYEKNPLPHEELNRVDQWLEKGATLGINSINAVDAVMKEFSSMLARDLNTGVNINCYVSCPNKQGFDTHYDMHDVFALHLEGKKIWRVFEPTIQTYPLHAQGNIHKGSAPEDTDPYIQHEMTPGDILYIPRGHWHDALSITPSIHLAVGPESRSGYEFMVWLASQMMNNEEFFRKDFPVANVGSFGGAYADEALNKHLASFRERLHEMIDAESLPEAFNRYIMSANPVRRQHQLPDTWTIKETITEDTEFFIPADQKALIRYDEESKQATIHIRGHMLQILGIPSSMLKTLFSQPNAKFSGSKLLASSSDIEWSKLKAALLHMYEHGLIVLKKGEES